MNHPLLEPRPPLGPIPDAGWLASLHVGVRRVLGWLAQAAATSTQKTEGAGRWRGDLIDAAAPRDQGVDEPEPTTTRQAILQYVRQHPGVPFPVLCAALPVVRQTIEYHVRHLEREGLLRCSKQGGSRRLHANGATRAEEQGDSSLRRRIVDLLAAGIASSSLLADRLQTSQRTIQRHLKDLRAAGAARPRPVSAQASQAVAALRAGLQDAA